MITAAGAIATCCGLIFAGLDLIPGFWQLFSQETLPERFLATITPVPSITPRPSPTLSPTSTNTPEPPLKLEFLDSGYESAATFLFLLRGEPSNENPEDQEILDGLSFLEENRIIMSVLNQSNTTIVINNQVPVQLMSHQSMESPVNVLSLQVGGKGFYRNFVVDIPMNTGSGTVWASFGESGVEIPGIMEPTVNAPDFFTLEPGEVEVFKIETRFEGAGEYKFRPGIEYYEDGKSTIIWTSAPITAYLPSNLVLWEFSSPDSGPKYSRSGQCWFAPNEQDVGVSYLERFYDCDF